MNNKLADVAIDPFGEHESRPDETTGENIPLTPVIPGEGGVPTWEPTREQETSLGERESQRNRVLRDRVEGLHKKLSQKWARTSKVFHFDLFELRDGQLYFRQEQALNDHGRESKIG